jgi:hypothetical protein
MGENCDPKKPWWKDWRSWSGILGLVMVALALLGKVGGCFGAASQALKAPERVADLEQRMDKNDTRDTLMCQSVNMVSDANTRMQANVSELDRDIDVININLARLGEHWDVEMVSLGKEDSSGVSP